jgi:hypothetical protein
MSNPALSEHERTELVRRLGVARQTVRASKSHPNLLGAARRRVDKIKRALGERGEVWWNDGAPDYNRRMVQNTPYATWFRGVRRSEACAA